MGGIFYTTLIRIRIRMSLSLLFRSQYMKYDIPAIMLTSDKSAEILNRIKEAGIVDYLSKPLNEAITREAVKDILRKYRE